MKRHFCTYFDHRYLPQGLALYRSLRRYCSSFCLWALCMDEPCQKILEGLAPEDLQVVSLDELERFDPELADAKGDRSRIEYYFTCSPCLPRYVLANERAADAVTYLDSDLWFFADPELVFDEIGAASVAIVPHRFAPNVRPRFSQYGEYNVGWLTFQRDADGMACLDWWRERCIEWCHDRVEGQRYADQKYLDRFEEEFAGVKVVHQRGANLAPWNVSNYGLRMKGNRVHVDSDPLVFYHFQGLTHVVGRLYDCNLVSYGVTLTPELREFVYRPYATELRYVAREVAPLLPVCPSFGDRLRQKSSMLLRFWNRVGRAQRFARSLAAGSYVVAAGRTEPEGFLSTQM